MISDEPALSVRCSLTDSNPAWLQYGEAAGETTLIALDELHHEIRQRSAKSRWEANEDHSRGCVGFGKDHLAEVFVFGEQHPPFPDGEIDDRVVIYARRDFSDGSHIMTSGA